MHHLMALGLMFKATTRHSMHSLGLAHLESPVGPYGSSNGNSASITFDQKGKPTGASLGRLTITAQSRLASIITAVAVLALVVNDKKAICK